MSDERIGCGQERAGSGIVGLDEVLLGGLIRNRFYLLEGKPGTGKTTIAIQFLLAAARRARALYITLSETERGAARHRALARLDAAAGFEIFELRAAREPAR